MCRSSCWARECISKDCCRCGPRALRNHGARENAGGAGTCTSGREVIFARRDGVAKFLRKLAGKGGPLTVVGTVFPLASVVTNELARSDRLPVRSCERGNRNLAGVHALRRARALIVAEKENLVPANRAAKGAAKLVLIEGSARGREIIARIEIGVAREFKNVAVKCVGSGLGDDIDLAAAEFAVLRVKIVGQNAKLGDGIEIGNDRRAHVHIFFARRFRLR